MVKVKCIVISFSYILYTLEQTIYRLDSFVKLVAGKTLNGFLRKKFCICLSHNSRYHYEKIHDAFSRCTMRCSNKCKLFLDLCALVSCSSLEQFQQTPRSHSFCFSPKPRRRDSSKTGQEPFPPRLAPHDGSPYRLCYPLIGSEPFRSPSPAQLDHAYV